MKVLGVIPARCGSKGFPHKNIAKIKNKSLLELAVIQGKATKSIDSVYVSTDCEEYEKIAKKAGAKSLGLRKKELATDTAKSIDVVIDLIKELNEKYDYLVLLQPTSPMRRPEDIDNMIEILLSSENSDAIVSVEPLEEPHPNKLKIINGDYIFPFLEGTTSEVPRQTLGKVYSLNGAIYVINIEKMMKKKMFITEKTIPYIMKNTINIDSKFDYDIILGLLELNKISIYGVNDE